MTRRTSPRSIGDPIAGYSEVWIHQEKPGVQLAYQPSGGPVSTHVAGKPFEAWVAKEAAR